MAGKMRPDIVASGVATLILMGVAYVAFSSAAFAVPTILTNVALVLAVVGAALVAMGIVLPRRSAVVRRRRP